MKISAFTRTVGSVYTLGAFYQSHEINNFIPDTHTYIHFQEELISHAAREDRFLRRSELRFDKVGPFDAIRQSDSINLRCVFQRGAERVFHARAREFSRVHVTYYTARLACSRGID